MDNKLVCEYLHERLLFHMGRDTVQCSSGRAGFLRPPAKDLHPSLRVQRLLRCSSSKWTQIKVESTQWRGFLEDWFTPGEEWRSARSFQRKAVPCNFTWEPYPLTSQKWHGKSENFWTKIWQTVIGCERECKARDPLAVRLKLILEIQNRWREETEKIILMLGKKFLPMNSSIYSVYDKKRDWEVMWFGCKDFLF